MLSTSRYTQKIALAATITLLSAASVLAAADSSDVSGGKTEICEKQFKVCISQCPTVPHAARLSCMQDCSNQHTICLNNIRAEYGLDPLPLPFPKK